MIDNPITIEIHTRRETIENPADGSAIMTEPAVAIFLRLGELRAVLSTGTSQDDAIGLAILRLERAVEWLKNGREAE